MRLPRADSPKNAISLRQISVIGREVAAPEVPHCQCFSLCEPK
jgi:hypothetical protein